MARAFLLAPEDVADRVRRSYDRQRRAWLAGEGRWPLRLPLGLPAEKDALRDLPRVQHWQARWQAWPGPGEVEWIERSWPRVGRQWLPAALVLPSPRDAAALIDEGEAWRRAEGRRAEALDRWPALAPVIHRDLDALMAWPAADWRRLLDLVGWIERHPASGLYPRQLPVPGVDSKWLEHHRGVLRRWLAALLDGKGGERQEASATPIAEAPARGAPDADTLASTGGDGTRTGADVTASASNPAHDEPDRAGPAPIGDGLDGRDLEPASAAEAGETDSTGSSSPGGAVTFEQLAGLRTPPVLLRLRLPDPRLSTRLGGLDDVTAPVAALASLDLPVRRVLIVENLQTGLAFDDLPETAIFMGQGYAVDVFAALPWLRDVPVFYWGDIDTHGFAILNRLRAHLPDVRSLLMDAATLVTHEALWTTEPEQLAVRDLDRLTPEESEVLAGLLDHRWGSRVRLEQERIDWSYALDAVTRILR